jgi:CRP-like cAMP-binding protein
MNLIATILAQSPPFQGLPASVLADLRSIAHLYRLHPQEVLFEKNDLAQFIYIVGEGSLRLLDYTPDQAVTLQVLGVGDLFSLAALKPDEVYPGRTEAIQESVVVGLAGADFRQVMAQQPALALCVADCLVTRLHQAHDRVRQMALERVEQRLANALLHLAQKFGSPSANDSTVIELPLSRQDLADFIGTTLETISRTMREWEKQGLVRSSRLRVTLVDSNGLSKLARPQA